MTQVTQLRRRVVERLQAVARHLIEIETQAEGLGMSVKKVGGVSLRRDARRYALVAAALDQHIDVIRDPRGPYRDRKKLSTNGRDGK